MGIEAIGRGIGSVGRAASVAPSIGRAASIGFSLGRISMIGRSSFEGGFSVSRIANPFKAAGSLGGFAENRGLSLLNPLGIKTIRNPFIIRPQVEAIRNPFKVNIDVPKPQLRAADVIAEAEAIISRAQRKPIKISEWTGNLVRVIANPFGAPKVEAVPQSIVQKRAENKATSRIVRTTSTPTLSVQQTEQVLEEKKILTERERQEKPQTKRREKQSMTKIKIVEAVEVTQLRRLAISEAARKIKEVAEKRGEKVVITGKILKRFLSGEFWKYISPLVGRGGYDGTIPLTLNAIENNPTEYTSLEQAQTELSKPVTEHIPLQKGEGGRLATVEEVREVLEGKEKEAIKSQTPAEMVVRRLARKSEVIRGEQVVTAVTEEKIESAETSLKDFPALAEVFQKAA